jgi:betaine lipid synthase
VAPAAAGVPLGRPRLVVDVGALFVRRLPFADVWKIFGEGKHERFAELLTRELGPFLSQGALKFW